MRILILAIAFILGAALGSFACCQAWRLYFKSAGQSLGKRSVCLSCRRQLKWFENIPVVSWIWLRGKCRGCGAKIGWPEILSELGLGLVFLLAALYFCVNGGFLQNLSPNLTANISALDFSGAFSAADFDQAFFQNLALLIVFLITIVLLTILLIYDAKWQLLPAKLLICAILAALLFAGLKVWWTVTPDWSEIAFSFLFAIAILAGLYYLLFLFSHETMVGSGDWQLALAVALLLGNWWLAIVTLFLSNALASLVMIPVVIIQRRQTSAKTKTQTFIARRGAFKTAKLKTAALKTSARAVSQVKVPFGPFLIIAGIAVFLAQGWLLPLVSGIF